MVDVESRNIPKELVSKVQFVDYNTTLSEARHILNTIPALIVTKDGEYFGIVDSRVLTSIKSLKFSSTEKVGKLAIKAPRVSQTTSVEDLAYYFYKLRVKNLPYIEDEKITGIVERKIVLKMLLSLHLLDSLTVEDAQSSPVLGIGSKASLAQGLKIMTNNKVNRLLILEDDKMAGILTNRNIHHDYTTNSQRLPDGKVVYKPANIKIASIMEKNVRTIESGHKLADAVRQMVENNAFSLVVTKDSSPTGILTISDILERVVAAKEVDNRNVVMTGFDENTYQYEESVREELKSLMHHIEHIHKIDIGYLTLRIKKIKQKSYEMQARISLGKRGTIRVHSEGESFHEAFKDLLKKLKTQVIRQKDEQITESKKRIGVSYGESE